MNCLAACAAASPPPAVPNPSWSGDKYSPIVCSTFELKILATRWQRVRPTAISLIPPFFFFRAIKGAPKNTGQTGFGILWFDTRLMKDVRGWTRSFPPFSAVALIKSFRCWGLRPSGPLAKPQGKEKINCSSYLILLDQNWRNNTTIRWERGDEDVRVRRWVLRS